MAVEPRVFKMCTTCNKLVALGMKKGAMFPSVLRTWNQYCPEHQGSAERMHDIGVVLATRTIPVEFFDVWGDDGERVCRACGAKLLTKKGKQHPMLRWCQNKKDDPEHDKLIDQTIKVFATERYYYINNLAHAQFDMIKDKFKDEIANGVIKANKNAGSTPTWRIYYYERSWSDVIACEGCGKLATIDTGIFHRSTIEPAHVHHKRPVHTIDANEAMKTPALLDLVFDHANFIALCLTCHGKAHRKAPDPRLTTAKIPGLKTIDSFFKKK